MSFIVDSLLKIKKQRFDNVESMEEKIRSHFPKISVTRKYGELKFCIDSDFNMQIMIGDKKYYCYANGLHGGDKKYCAGRNKYSSPKLNLYKQIYTKKAEITFAIGAWVANRNRIIAFKETCPFDCLFEKKHKAIYYDGSWYYMHCSSLKNTRHLFSADDKTGEISLIESGGILLLDKHIMNGVPISFIAGLNKKSILKSGFIDENEEQEYRQKRYEHFMKARNIGRKIKIPDSVLHAKSKPLILDKIRQDIPSFAAVCRWYSYRLKKGLLIDDKYILSYKIQKKDI